MNNMASYDFPYESKYIDISGSKIHYIEKGQGDPILFLHTIPTSNYIWRKVIPYLTPLGRCIAPDLIGFGKSDKPNIQYSVLDHINYINQFIEKLNLKRLTLVLHGWGSLIGFHYAMQNEKNCKGLVFYESFLRPFQGENVSLPWREQIAELEAEQNFDAEINGIKFVDQVLLQGMLNPLSPNDLSYYHAPFLNGNNQAPLKQYFYELPRGDGKSMVDKVISEYDKKLIASNIPKLMLYSIPGFITTIADVIWAKEHVKRLEIVEVGEDLHYAQESNPTLMGEAISIWLQGVEQTV